MRNRDVIHQNFLNRLKEVVGKKFGFGEGKEHGIQTKIAETIGIGQRTVSNWFDENKKTVPNAEQFLKIYRTIGTSPNYLLGIDDTEKLRPERLPIPVLELADLVDVKEKALRHEDFITVPLVAGKIAASIGDGILVDEHVEDWTIIHKSVTGRRKLISIRVDKKDGLSMYPILKPGDIVIIDREDIEIRSTGIYAVRIDDGCTVKKLQRAGHQLLLIPENKELPYKTGIIDLRIDSSPIIGRAIWCSKTL